MTTTRKTSKQKAVKALAKVFTPENIAANAQPATPEAKAFLQEEAGKLRDNSHPGLFNVTVPQPKVFVLARGATRYLFQPQGDDCHVQRVESKSVTRYFMPRLEARYLFARLRKQGFETF